MIKVPRLEEILKHVNLFLFVLYFTCFMMGDKHQAFRNMSHLESIYSLKLKQRMKCVFSTFVVSFFRPRSSSTSPAKANIESK